MPPPNSGSPFERGSSPNLTRGIAIDEFRVKAAVLGGAILGGGGGGWIEEGEKLGRLALEKGFRAIAPIDAVADDALLLTVSLVGAPSVGRSSVQPSDYIRSVECFVRRSGMNVTGLIASEIGAVGAVNGWLQSAALGFPLVDAPCNGRAHPTGLMGSMGLHRLGGYVSRQTAVGGKAKTGTHVECYYEGRLEATAAEILRSAVAAGGMVAVARNPASAGYVRRNGAPGALRKAIELGEATLRAADRGGEAMAETILQLLGGEVLIRGTVQRRTLTTLNGLDLGILELRSETGHDFGITFWNEYMTLEREGERLAVFPDLIATLDRESGLPVPSAEIREGQRVLVITVPASRLILGAGCRDPELLVRVEDTVGKLRLGQKDEGAEGRTLVGFVTLGHSPRPDLREEMAALLDTDESGASRGKNFSILECGALDGLTRDEIEQLAPDMDKVALLTRLSDGTSVIVGKRKIVEHINDAIAKLEGAGASIVALLCTEQFAGLEADSARLVLPWEVMRRTVKAHLPGGNLGVLAPLAVQEDSMRRRWESETGLTTCVQIADPYGGAVDWDAIGRRFRENDVALVVLDCFGYSCETRDQIHRATGRPVVAPRVLLAEAIKTVATCLRGSNRGG